MLRNFPILGFPLASVLGARAWPNLSFLPRSNDKLGVGKHEQCPPFNKGNFTIDYFQLYPENADWDAHSCQVIFGSLWNGSVAIYNPYLSQITEILTFPGITNSGTYHIGGVAFDPLSNLYTILTDPAAAWATEGGDLSGDHLLIKHNPITNHTLWTLNLTTISQERYGGFQDVETDRRGNTYVVGTFPGTILRADKHGREIKEWYLPDLDPFPTVTPGTPFAKRGFGSLAAVPGTEILLSDDGDGRICRFDMRADRGHLVAVLISPKVLCNDTDAIYLPPKYGGAVLVASWGSGVQVLRSRNKRWERAEYVGTVEVEYPRDEEFPGGGVSVAVTQIGPSGLYVILGFGIFRGWRGQWRAGGRGFPMPDITGEVEAFLRK